MLLFMVKIFLIFYSFIHVFIYSTAFIECLLCDECCAKAIMVEGEKANFHAVKGVKFSRTASYNLGTSRSPWTMFPSPGSICLLHNRPMNQRWGVEARNTTLFRKQTGGEDGQLMSQNNHLVGGYLVFLENREVWRRWGSKVKRS